MNVDAFWMEWLIILNEIDILPQITPLIKSAVARGERKKLCDSFLWKEKCGKYIKSIEIVAGNVHVSLDLLYKQTFWKDYE